MSLFFMPYLTFWFDSIALGERHPAEMIVAASHAHNRMRH